MLPAPYVSPLRAVLQHTGARCVLGWEKPVFVSLTAWGLRGDDPGDVGRALPI